MTLGVTGWGVVSSAGIGSEAFAAAVAGLEQGPQATVDAHALYDDPLPSPVACALMGLDVRQVLGRKGTTSLDRRTALALIACREALRNGQVAIGDDNRQRIGVALGTTWGSLKAMSDYTRESLTEERPYLVEPSRFPNTVMNCASGQTAIWYGLKGVNATIAGGTMAFLNVLEYTANLLRCGHADTILAGAVEEFTPHASWAHHIRHDGRPPVPAGEAAVVFVVETSEGARAAGRHVCAEVLAVRTGYALGGRSGGRLRGALESCIRRALAGACIAPGEVSVAATADADGDTGSSIASEALAAVLGPSIRRIAPKNRFGDCQAADVALQLASILALPAGEADHAPGVAVMTGWTEEGAVGAAVVRRLAGDVRADRE